MSSILRKILDKLNTVAYVCTPIILVAISMKIAEKIENLVERILEMKKNNEDTTELEREIDQLVYKMYYLTPEEIAIVEGI